MARSSKSFGHSRKRQNPLERCRGANVGGIPTLWVPRRAHAPSPGVWPTFCYGERDRSHGFALPGKSGDFAKAKCRLQVLVGSNSSERIIAYSLKEKEQTPFVQPSGASKLLCLFTPANGAPADAYVVGSLAQRMERSFPP